LPAVAQRARGSSGHGLKLPRAWPGAARKKLQGDFAKRGTKGSAHARVCCFAIAVDACKDPVSGVGCDTKKLVGYRVCLEEAVAWAQQRHTFGKRLADHQVIRHKVAEMKRQINACQANIMHCSREYTEGNPNPGDIALLKVQCSLTMEYCAREAMQILGGMGYMRESRVERIYREVRVQAIGGGSEEIMRDLAARQYGF